MKDKKLREILVRYGLIDPYDAQNEISPEINYEPKRSPIIKALLAKNEQLINAIRDLAELSGYKLEYELLPLGSVNISERRPYNSFYGYVLKKIITCKECGSRNVEI